MSQIQNSKRASLQAVHFVDLEIRILNLFRISKFELRISKSKFDHFVNFVRTKKIWRARLIPPKRKPPMHPDELRCRRRE